MFDDLAKAVLKINQVAPRPGLEPLEVSEPYDLTSDWPDRSWPGATKPGVYVFADQEGGILYVGKASCGRTIGNRLADYWNYSPERTAAPIDEKAEGVRYVLTVTVPGTDFAFEVPAIEEWLIRELKPPRNRQGR